MSILFYSNQKYIHVHFSICKKCCEKYLDVVVANTPASIIYEEFEFQNWWVSVQVSNPETLKFIDLIVQDHQAFVVI